jgi:hypothetical protein
MLTTKDQFASVFLVTQLRMTLIRDMISMQEVGNDSGIACLNGIDIALRDIQDLLRGIKKPEDIEFAPRLIDCSMPDEFPEGHIMPHAVVTALREEFEKAKDS